MQLDVARHMTYVWGKLNLTLCNQWRQLPTKQVQTCGGSDCIVCPGGRIHYSIGPLQIFKSLTFQLKLWFNLIVSNPSLWWEYFCLLNIFACLSHIPVWFRQSPDFLAFKHSGWYLGPLSGFTYSLGFGWVWESGHASNNAQALIWCLPGVPNI